MKDWLSERSNKVFLLFVGVFFLYIAILYNLQVIPFVEKNQQLAIRNASAEGVLTESEEFIDDIENRGAIYFLDKTNMHVAAATNKEGYLVTSNNRFISNNTDYVTELEKVISNLDKEAVQFRLNKKNDPYEVLHKYINKSEAEQIRELNLPGISTTIEKFRFYPAGILAAQTVGFVGYDGSGYSGRYGVESYYNDILSNRSAGEQKSLFAQLISGVKNQKETERSKKTDIVLTIEPEVQLYLRTKLEKLMSDWSSESVGGIIINPKTGAIYAMETLPSFDLNDFGKSEFLPYHTNPIIESSFEMGSVVKPLVMAIGLEQEKIRADTEYFDTGFVEIGDNTIHNYDKKGRGQVTMQDVIGDSLNTGMVLIQKKVGIDIMRSYFNKFGFSKTTGIDLPGEVSGQSANLGRDVPIEWANISFGQGFAISPIQLVRALTSLANQGMAVKPHVVHSYVNDNGELVYKNQVESEKIFEPGTVRVMTDMLVKNIDTYIGKGKHRLQYYSIAAKTGTAQIFDNESGKYFVNKNLHAFSGYFPAYDPEFLVLLYAYNPKGVKYSAETLTVPFMDTARFLLNYYGIAPDRDLAPLSTK